MSPGAEPPTTPRPRRPARAFVALALVFGGAFALVTPPLQAPDELRHLLRTWALTDGQLLAEDAPGRYAGVRVPRDLLGLKERLGTREVREGRGVQDPARLLAELRRATPGDPRQDVLLPSLYSPVPYVAQGVALAASRALGASALCGLYAGRLANLALFVALGALALARAPAHRWTLFLLATTPMILFEAASLTADCVTNAVSLLLVATALRSAAAAGPLRRAELAELALLAALVGLSKQAYWPLAGVVLLIPAHRFTGTPQRVAAAAAVVGAALVPAALWFAALRSLEIGPLVPGSDPDAQMRFMVGHPLRTLRVFGDTLWTHFPRYVRTFVGQLGYLDTRLPGPVYVLYPAFLVGVSLLDGGRASPVRGRTRALCLAIVALSWLATIVVAYVGWNRPGDVLVRYVQGRYFIPFAPLLFVALHHPGAAGLPPGAQRAVVAVSGATLAVAVAALVSRYWLG